MTWNWFSYGYGILTVIAVIQIHWVIKTIIKDWIENIIAEKKESAK